jgi:RNA polymerase sigma-70 factor (ECF subfamily)
VGVTDDGQGGRGQARPYPAAAGGPVTVAETAPAVVGAVARAPAPTSRSDRSHVPESRRQKTFSRLVAAHDEKLRSLAYHLLGDRDLMDDVLQEVYIKAYVGLPGFRKRSSMATWLYRITYTTCIDALRRQRRFTVLTGELPDDVRDPAPDPGDELADRERLAAALALLPPEQRVAVLLVDREGFDYQTVAEVLAIPMGTAASRVWAARRALRRALGSPTTEGQT